MAKPWAGWLQRERSEARVREVAGAGALMHMHSGRGLGLLAGGPRFPGDGPRHPTARLGLSQARVGH